MSEAFSEEAVMWSPEQIRAYIESRRQEEDAMDIARAGYVVLDVETYRTRDVVIARRVAQEAMDKPPANNVAKEKKLTWDTEAARGIRAREALEKTAIDVLLAEVLCVVAQARYTDGHGQTRTDTDLGWFDGMNVTECDALEGLVVYLDAAAGADTVWVGHNIAGFDLPVLLNRWRHYGIRPPEHFPRWTGKRWLGRVWDTMLRTPCNNGLGYVSLERACEAYGIGGAKGREWNGAPLDGSRVGEAFEAGEYALILDYCADDVRVEEALYLVQTCGGTWGCYGETDTVAAQVSEIEGSGLSDTQKRLAVYSVLDRAGRILRL